MRERPAQTFLREVILPYEGDDCLTWPFYRMANGYGTIHFNGSCRLVSRIVCELAHGEPPTRKHEAAHSCGKGHEGCVNPHHLRWATSSENKQDQLKHGTDKRGSRSPLAKLTEAQVLEICAQRGKAPQKELASRFGISVANVCRLQLGNGWLHLERPKATPRYEHVPRAS